MRVHDNREYVNPVHGYRGLGAPRDTVTLGDDLRLTRWYDVPPVGIYAHAQHAGVVIAQPVGVKQPHSRIVGNESVELRIRVVGLQHEVPGTSEGLEGIAGLGRVVETLGTDVPGRGDRVAVHVKLVVGVARRAVHLPRDLEDVLVAPTLVQGHVVQVLLTTRLDDRFVLEGTEQMQSLVFSFSNEMVNDFRMSPKIHSKNWPKFLKIPQNFKISCLILAHFFNHGTISIHFFQVWQISAYCLNGKWVEICPQLEK